jgi:hypothetical protein
MNEKEKKVQVQQMENTLDRQINEFIDAIE